jgi:hypothetical protein
MKSIILRLLLLGAACYFTPQVKAWLWYQMPPDLQMASWEVSGYLWPALCAIVLFGLPLLRKTVRGSIWNTAPGRWLIGKFATGCIIGAQVGAVAALFGPHVAMLAAPIAIYFKSWSKHRVGRWSRPFRRMRRDWAFGMGGSAEMAGVLEEWACRWETGQVFFGTSTYDPGWKVGIPDDRHLITIAGSRAGKGRDAIIPNLLLWPGSAIITDPKGQNAAVTAEARRKMGQAVYILDPLGEMGVGQQARFNPLLGLGLHLVDYHERVSLIAEAIIVTSGSGNSAFFEGSARILISGLIDTVVRSDVFKPHEKHLGTVRDILIMPEGLPTAMMGKLGGMASAAAALNARASDRAGGDVFATVIEQTKWLDSPVIREALSASDFQLEELLNGKTTIFLVVPPRYLDVHARFTRLIINLALATADPSKKGQHPILFVMDEFYASVGRLELISKSAAVLAGCGLRLWPIVQNIGQLQELFPKNWETLLSNAGAWQIFAVNDKASAEYMSELLGQRIMWKQNTEGEWEPGRLASVRDQLEFRQSTSRESGRQMVFVEGGKAFLLNREHYDDMFSSDQYASDPSERKSARHPFFARCKAWAWRYAGMSDGRG